MACLPTRSRSLKPDAITLNKRCVAVSSHDGDAEATFEDGSVVKAPYVIGADGIHSKVRVCLFGPSKPVFTGCIAWRGLIPMEQPAAPSGHDGREPTGSARTAMCCTIRCAAAS